MSSDWIEHRRADGERVGWLRMSGEAFIAVDALGRDMTGELDYVAAEEALETRGLAFLAEPWELELPDGRTVRVAISEINARSITVREDEYGAASVAGTTMPEHVLPFPAPPGLRPLRGR